MPREQTVRRNCSRELKRWGKVVPYFAGAYGEAGTPDLIACVHGRMVLVECKQPGAKPTLLQERRILEWRDAGALVLVATDADELRQALIDVFGPVAS